MKIHFDMIDCKDGYFILGTNDVHVWRTNENNLEVVTKARIKYLEKLAELQKEIRQEFEPQLDVITDENMLDTNEAIRIRDELDKKYPLNNTHWGRLFYT